MGTPWRSLLGKKQHLPSNSIFSLSTSSMPLGQRVTWWSTGIHSVAQKLQVFKAFTRPAWVFHRYKKTSVFSDAWMSRFSSLVEDAYLWEIALTSKLSSTKWAFGLWLSTWRHKVFEKKSNTLFQHNFPSTFQPTKKKRFQCPPHRLCHSRRRRSRQHDHPVTVEEDSMNFWFDSKCFEDFFKNSRPPRWYAFVQCPLTCRAKRHERGETSGGRIVVWPWIVVGHVEARHQQTAMVAFRQR